MRVLILDTIGALIDGNMGVVTLLQDRRIKALQGKITCTAARDAFIEATKEADIYIGKQRLSINPVSSSVLSVPFLRIAARFRAFHVGYRSPARSLLLGPQL
jgi:hypothetical protein